MDNPQDPKKNRRPDPRSADEKRMELTEHLAELRTRIIRSIWYLVLGAILTYQFFAPIYGFFYRPLHQEMIRQNTLRAHTGDSEMLVLPHALHDPPTKSEVETLVKAVQWIYDHPSNAPIMSIVFKNFHEPFMVRLTVSVITGFILVLPFVLWELSMFIAPALTPQERKPLRVLMPISAFLLALGITTAYITMFFAMRWFLSYLDDFPQPAVLYQDPNDYILFFVKMMAAFGIAFQLPVVLMFGSFVGFITSRGLIKHWRWGVVIAVMGGVLTPGNDMFSWALMVFPLLFLYAGSILLVKMVERWKAQEAKRREGT